MKMMKKFPISYWLATGEQTPWEGDGTAKVDTWNELGITLAMVPCNLDHKEQVYSVLDRAQQYDMKVFLCDPRANWRKLKGEGEEKYREGMKEALADFGSHPAMFGFFIGDEPDAPDAEAAFAAVRINNEMAPHLTAYLNLLPWFDWIGPRMGTDAYAPYLDRVVNEGKTKLLSYDCYAQMWPDREVAYRDYFNNLREYYLASKRNDVPFFNIVLSSGHYDYRCPSKGDMWWQLTTSVAHGASGVTWFVLEIPGVWENYRDLPINVLGDKTEQFYWLREVNCIFNNYCGEVMATLKIDKCYHVGETFGGMPLFEPFDNIVDIKGNNPLIISSFYNEEGERFYVICNNCPEESTHFTLKTKGNIKMKRCVYGNKFEPIVMASDPIAELKQVPDQSIGLWMAPGQMVLLKEEK